MGNGAISAAGRRSTRKPKSLESLPGPGADEVEEEQVLSQTYDVFIAATSADAELTEFIKGQLQSAYITVYSNSSESKEATELAAKVLVDAKLLVFIPSENAAKSSICQDQVSLAYISDKPIVLAAHKEKNELLPEFQVGMRLTLQALSSGSWTVFNDAEKETTGRQFVQLVQEFLTTPVQEVAELVQQPMLESAPAPRTHLYTQLTRQPTEAEGPVVTFWDRNFPNEDEVLWYKFQQAFLLDFDSQLQTQVNEENIPWLLDMLQNEIFEGKDKITKEAFMHVRGDSNRKNAFWRSVSRTAVEKFNMGEVFNMQSSVRLTAIENMAKLQNPAVIEALIRLIEDDDANVRAVAAISLGRTGTTEERVVDELIKLLRDEDRIVRQSTCLSLGTMKAAKGIPHIARIWRNDVISVVRSAARTALENMGLDEAMQVLLVTKVLEEEIEKLAGIHRVHAVV